MHITVQRLEIDRARERENSELYYSRIKILGSFTDRQTDRQTETERQRQTDRDTDRQTETQRERQTDRDRDRHTQRQSDTERMDFNVLSTGQSRPKTKRERDGQNLRLDWLRQRQM